MPVTLAPQPRTEPVPPPHKLWTRDECTRLEQAGLVDPRQYELIDGELIRRLGKQQPHMRSLWLVVEWLRSVFGSRFVAQEPSIDVRPEDNPTSDPEPDAILISRPFVELDGRARHGDLRLIVEVSDTTLLFDLGPKAALYARAGVTEYWVLDVKGQRLLVHRQPHNGAYGQVVAYSGNELAAAGAAPAAFVRVGDLF